MSAGSPARRFERQRWFLKGGGGRGGPNKLSWMRAEAAAEAWTLRVIQCPTAGSREAEQPRDVRTS